MRPVAGGGLVDHSAQRQAHLLGLPLKPRQVPRQVAQKSLVELLIAMCMVDDLVVLLLLLPTHPSPLGAVGLLVDVLSGGQVQNTRSTLE